MQTKIKSNAALPGNTTRLEVGIVSVHWQQPVVVKTQPTSELNRPVSRSDDGRFPNHGVPFSPLND